MWDGTVLIAFYGKEPGVVIAMLRPLETTSLYKAEVTFPYIHPGKGPWSPETWRWVWINEAASHTHFPHGTHDQRVEAIVSRAGAGMGGKGLYG